MTPRAERSAPSTERRAADGLRAVPVAVLVFVGLDSGSSIIAQALGMTGLGADGWLNAAQMLLVVLALAATMYHRPRTAVLLSAVVAGLALVAGGTGAEAWLLAVTAVTAVLRGTRRQLALVMAGQLAYAVCFAVKMEDFHPGWGWEAGLTLLVIAAVSLTGGLVVRRLLQARDRRRDRVRRLEQENAEIRAVERARLADDLQTVVTRGLATIEQHLEAAADGPSDLVTLRKGLARVDGDSRSLLTELRGLLAILRQDPSGSRDGGPAPGAPAPRRWLRHLAAWRVRVGATAVFLLLAGGALVGDLGPGVDSDLVVQVVGLLACAVVVWRPALGAGAAVAALLVSAWLGTSGYWDSVSTSLLCLLGAFLFGVRRLWVVVVPVAAYGALVAVTAPDDRTRHVLILWYAGFLAIVLGLAARHLASARADSLRRMRDLAAERGRVESEERSAVARELHDVVAHQLSVTTMLVMASSLSDDPGTLETTLAKVRRSTTAAHHELGTLLHAMRALGVDGAAPAPLASPLATGRALGEQLAEQGHRPVMEIDPRADELDVTTQRTLMRIMQEATTNILRYAPAGARCRCTVTIDGDGVRLCVVSPLAAGERVCDLSLGWGLRGIRERVELTGGAFTAGPDHDQWVLAVTLPLVEPAGSVSTPDRPSRGRLVGALPGVSQR